MSERDKELSLVQHLGELRDRLMVASIAVIATTAISFLFATDIIKILLVPAGVDLTAYAAPWTGHPGVHDVKAGDRWPLTVTVADVGTTLQHPEAVTITISPT